MENQVQSSHIPSEAYLYFPKIDNSQYPEKPRVYFDGNTRFTFYENQMINNFRSYATKENYTLKPMWTDNRILRFLYANDFKMDKTLSSVKEHTVFRETKVPVQLDKSLEEFLNSGIIYVHGRDHEFRPIVVANMHLINPKKIDAELIKKAFLFNCEYVINEWLLPGQIEDWIVVVDVKGMSVGTFKAIKQILGDLRDNYKGRLNQMYLINTSASLYFLWDCINKKFKNDRLLKKAKIYKGQIPIDLLKTVNKEQVQEKHGGSAKNVTQYWPPAITSNNYFVTPHDSEALISEEQYISMYKSGALANMRVDQSRISTNNSTGLSAESVKIQQATSIIIPSGDHIEPSPVLEDDISCSVDFDDVNEKLEDNQIEMVVREFQQFFVEHPNSI